MKGAGALDRRIQFRRATFTDDGFTKDKSLEDHGDPVWAAKTELSDGERWRAGQVDAISTTRFVVRWSAFTAAITTDDKIASEGREFDITGIKEAGGRRQWLEITCAERKGTQP